MNIEKLVMRTSVAVLLLCVVGVAQAQWNTNTITFLAPTTCTSGQPIANCPITGYRVERAASQGGAYAPVGTTPASPFTHLSAAAGLNCYRVTALSAQGDSVPSVVTSSACKTNVEPSGPPSPPTGVTVTSPIVFNVVPNYQRFAFERGSRYPAMVKVGAACDKSRSVGEGYFVISRLSQVTPRPARGTVLVAKCA